MVPRGVASGRAVIPGRLLWAPEQVRDCWAGVDVARRLGWINGSFLKSDATLQELCQEYTHRIARYDAAWIIPGKLMVSSDPVTTVLDPDPVTFEKLVPDCCGGGNSKGCGGRNSEGSGGTSPPPGRGSVISRISSKSRLSRLSRRGSLVEDSNFARFTSNESVVKEYDAPCAPGAARADDRDFASFMVDSGIGLLVRANFDDEEGMLTDSYAIDTFKPFNIRQADIQVVDKYGAIPSPECVGQMIDQCSGLMEGENQDAVMVHCKGGFGRSVVLGCCAIMHHYDVPGHALLGWVRIARPGAVTCSEQERFLKGMRGAKDVRAYVGRSAGSKGITYSVRMARSSPTAAGYASESDGVKVSCGAPCWDQ